MKRYILIVLALAVVGCGSEPSTITAQQCDRAKLQDVVREVIAADGVNTDANSVVISNITSYKDSTVQVRVKVGEDQRRTVHLQCDGGEYRPVSVSNENAH